MANNKMRPKNYKILSVFQGFYIMINYIISSDTFYVWYKVANYHLIYMYVVDGNFKICLYVYPIFIQSVN